MGFILVIAWLGSLFIAFSLGVIYTSYVIAKRTINEEYTPEKFAPVYTLQKDAGVYYLYEQSTGNFAGQSAELADLALDLQKTNINLAYVVSIDESTAYWFINGRVRVKTLG